MFIPAFFGFVKQISATPAIPAKKNREMVIILKRFGGYVPEKQALLDQTPVLAIFEDGSLTKRENDPQTGKPVRKEGRLEKKELDNLLRQLKKLGFWSWDNQKIQKAIFRRNLITDLPTTTLSVSVAGQTKTVSVYGLDEYHENFAIPELENPHAAVKLLEGLMQGDPL